MPFFPADPFERRALLAAVAGWLLFFASFFVAPRGYGIFSPAQPPTVIQETFLRLAQGFFGSAPVLETASLLLALWTLARSRHLTKALSSAVLLSVGGLWIWSWLTFTDFG